MCTGKSRNLKAHALKLLSAKSTWTVGLRDREVLTHEYNYNDLSDCNKEKPPGPFCCKQKGVRGGKVTVNSVK